MQSFGLLLLNNLAGVVPVGPRGRGSLSPVLPGSHLHDSVVNGTANAVLLFDIELGDVVAIEGDAELEVLLGGGIHKVSDFESLHRLVLGALPAAVEADDGLDVAPVASVLAVISPLLGHCGLK